MSLNEDFILLTKERKDINDMKTKQEKTMVEAKNLDPYLSFETTIGAVFYSFFRVLIAFSLISIFFILFVGVLDYFDVHIVLNNEIFVNLLCCFLLLSIVISFKKIKRKTKEMIQFKKDHEKREALYKKSNELGDKREERYGQFLNKVSGFDMQEYLKDKDLQFFSKLKQEELDVIDDFKTVVKNNRGLNHYMHFNKKEKSSHYILTD